MKRPILLKQYHRNNMRTKSYNTQKKLHHISLYYVINQEAAKQRTNFFITFSIP